MDHLLTEARNPASTNLDELSALEIVRLMNAEDQKVAAAVGTQTEAIARAIEVIAERLRLGGRLIYAGAGTSGRLGVLDATECPPTFNSPPGQVVGIIAGGPQALTRAVEGAEDHPEYAENDLREHSLSDKDVVVGIATSGRTAYVLGAMRYARAVGAYAIGLSCNPDSELEKEAGLAITVAVGPEVLSGSTRLKAGTATKLVLNMLTTGAMVLLGKTYGNLMVDLRATNNKLKARTNRIVRHLTGVSVEEAETLLACCGGELKTALITQLGRCEPVEARRRLEAAAGRVAAALSTLAPAPLTYQDLLIGIDGGGSHTVALLARCEGEKWTVLGEGRGGPSNLQAVGAASACAALDKAVRGAFLAAGLARGTVEAACLGLAGAGRPGDQDVIRRWTEHVGLAKQVDVTADAALLLEAGTPAGWGLAIVAGTGSIVIGKAEDGRTARAGGWGYLIGDEGSAYAIVVQALQIIANAADWGKPQGRLGSLLLAALQVSQPPDLVPRIHAMDRPALAALAPLVLQAAAEGDGGAYAVTEAQLLALGNRVAAVKAALFKGDQAVPVALAGGMLVHHEAYRERFLNSLRQSGTFVGPICVVTEPAEGALRRASRMRQDINRPVRRRCD